MSFSSPKPVESNEAVVMISLELPAEFAHEMRDVYGLKAGPDGLIYAIDTQSNLKIFNQYTHVSTTQLVLQESLDSFYVLSDRSIIFFSDKKANKVVLETSTVSEVVCRSLDLKYYEFTEMTMSADHISRGVVQLNTDEFFCFGQRNAYRLKLNPNSMPSLQSTLIDPDIAVPLSNGKQAMIRPHKDKETGKIYHCASSGWDSNVNNYQSVSLELWGPTLKGDLEQKKTIIIKHNAGIDFCHLVSLPNDRVALSISQKEKTIPDSVCLQIWDMNNLQCLQDFGWMAGKFFGSYSVVEAEDRTFIFTCKNWNVPEIFSVNLDTLQGAFHSLSFRRFTYFPRQVVSDEKAVSFSPCSIAKLILSWPEKEFLPEAYSLVKQEKLLRAMDEGFDVYEKSDLAAGFFTRRLRNVVQDYLCLPSQEYKKSGPS